MAPAQQAEASSSKQPVKAGHVSMMNDVLINQLSVEQLRGSLRNLLGASHDNAAVFTAYVRSQMSSLPSIPSPQDLMASPPGPPLLDLLREARCRFAAHILPGALELLARLPEAMVQTKTRISDSGQLRDQLVYAGGDMLQAAQALKEGGERSDQTKSALLRLIHSLERCRLWIHEQMVDSGSSTAIPFFPFERALPQMIDCAKLCFPSDLEIKRLQMPTHNVAYSPKKAKKLIPTVRLGSIEVPRLFFGLWQLSSPAWGSASQEECMAALSSLVSSGFIAADMADHYADAEILFGTFRNHILFPSVPPHLICATKYCQFAPAPKNDIIDKAWVMKRVMERFDRVGGVIDLLQVHWQHLDDERYLTVFEHLVEITKTNPEILRAVGLCNFDAKTTEKVCRHLLQTKGDVGIVSNQVQYSLIDQRPRFALANVCKEFGLRLLTYGTFCGGFFAEKWVDVPEHDLPSKKLNTSQRKYLDMIRAWGGWPLFQDLLAVLTKIATKYQAEIPNVVARWVLDQPETGVVIIGSRLGVTSHNDSNLRTMELELDAEDMKAIDAVLAKSRAKEMFEQIGDCGSEYR